mmetsp:Transcript_561/g.1546  ORF Transcript_561/g.1546 Transcript_561/m.1546 type:complete len:218 (-) Transcript_561:556-1209(-)
MELLKAPQGLEQAQHWREAQQHQLELRPRPSLVLIWLLGDAQEHTAHERQSGQHVDDIVGTLHVSPEGGADAEADHRLGHEDRINDQFHDHPFEAFERRWPQRLQQRDDDSSHDEGSPQVCVPACSLAGIRFLKELPNSLSAFAAAAPHQGAQLGGRGGPTSRKPGRLAAFCVRLVILLSVWACLRIFFDLGDGLRLSAVALLALLAFVVGIHRLRI